MAINKPYNISISGETIDANESNVITWSISGAIQTEKSLVFKLNSDDSVVFTYPKTSSYAQNYTIGTGTLTNGIEYKVLITAYDIDSNSAVSDAVVFSCSTTPVVTSTPPTISAPSAEFTATYFQNEGISMSSWIIYLYDEDRVEIDNSGIQTDSIIAYIFSGFISNQTYYYKVNCTASDGLIGTTGMLEIVPLFAQPNLRVNLSLENTDDAGISATWNAYQIIGTGTNYSFIDNKEVDITSGSVYFDSGFLIENDFTYKEWVRDIDDVKYLIATGANVIISSIEPFDDYKLWIDDSTIVGDINLTTIASPNEPIISTCLWIDDSNLVVDRNMTIDFNIDEPTTNPTAILWLDLGVSLDDVTILTLTGDEGSYYLRYYNSTFYLYEDDSIVDSVHASGESYYILIQQIDGVASLTVEILSYDMDKIFLLMF
jgi:hypothetical protein